MTKKMDTTQYELIGHPVVGQIIVVPTAKRADWLSLLNGLKLINASPIHNMWVERKGERIADQTYILVVVELPSLRASVNTDGEGIVTLDDPAHVARTYIDQSIRTTSGLVT